MITAIILLSILAFLYTGYSLYRKWVEKQPDLRRRMLKKKLIFYRNMIMDITITTILAILFVVFIIFSLTYLIEKL